MRVSDAYIASIARSYAIVIGRKRIFPGLAAYFIR